MTLQLGNSSFELHGTTWMVDELRVDYSFSTHRDSDGKLREPCMLCGRCTNRMATIKARTLGAKMMFSACSNCYTETFPMYDK